MGLVGKGWANCFRTHNELTMGPPGKYPLAPSVSRLLKARSLFARVEVLVTNLVSDPEGD